MQVGDAPVGRVCGANAPVPYSGSLEPEVVPGTAEIVAGVRALLGVAALARG